MNSAMVASTVIIAPLGAVAIAANSFAVTAESLCYMPGYGIGSAATTLVGRCVGAGDAQKARHYGAICTAMGAVFMGLIGLVMMVLCPLVFRVLTPDPAVQALSLRRVQSTLSNRVFMSFYYLFIYPVLLLSFRLPALLLSVITLGTLRLLALLLIALVQTLGAVCDWRRLRKLRNHLQAGGRIEHTQENPGWTKRSVAEKIANPILTAVWIVLLLSFVVKTGNPARSTQTDLNASPLPAASSFLTLPQEDADDRDELTLLARRDVLVQDNIYTLEERAGSFRYDAEYYDMRAPWLAKWLADDFARYDARGIFSSRTYRITSLDLPALDADTAYCYFLQDTRRGHYWGHRVIVQKGCKVISADIWWTYDSDFPAETFARALLAAISE